MMVTKLSANADTGNQILERLQQLEDRIERACLAAGRRRDSVRLLPVSKTQPAEVLQAAYAVGLRSFAENYLQEALGKIAQLSDDCEWHYIGPLQSNKTRAIAQSFDWVHSVERLSIARRLSDQRPADKLPLKLCIQVNISGEASKSGVSPAGLAELISAIKQLPRLQLEGLMALPQATDDIDKQRASFRQLRELRDNMLPQASVLSMGMSNDLEAAIAEGSSLIRIGTALFGPRLQHSTQVTQSTSNEPT